MGESCGPPGSTQGEYGSGDASVEVAGGVQESVLSVPEVDQPDWTCG